MDTKTRSLYVLSTRDPPQNRGHIQTESEGLEKDIPYSILTHIYGIQKDGNDNPVCETAKETQM